MNVNEVEPASAQSAQRNDVADASLLPRSSSRASAAGSSSADSYSLAEPPTYFANLGARDLFSVPECRGVMKYCATHRYAFLRIERGMGRLKLRPDNFVAWGTTHIANYKSAAVAAGQAKSYEEALRRVDAALAGTPLRLARVPQDEREQIDLRQTDVDEVIGFPSLALGHVEAAVVEDLHSVARLFDQPTPDFTVGLLWVADNYIHWVATGLSVVLGASAGALLVSGGLFGIGLGVMAALASRWAARHAPHMELAASSQRPLTYATSMPDAQAAARYALLGAALGSLAPQSLPFVPYLGAALGAYALYRAYRGTERRRLEPLQSQAC